MDEIEQDDYIEFVSSTTSREAWKCTLCSSAGNGFYRRWCHVTSDGHKTALEEIKEEAQGAAKKQAEQDASKVP